MFSCNNLTLKTNGLVLAKGLGFTLYPGVILSIEGKNGEGKSTLLRTFATLHQGFETCISYNGVNIEDELQEYRSLISYIGHDSFLFKELTIFENLEFWGKIHGRDNSIIPASSVFGLTSIINEKIKNLSAGTQHKVLLTTLLINNSKIWLLDEPFVNLDSEAINVLSNVFVSKTQQGGIIIFSSHHKTDLTNVSRLNLKDYTNA